MKSYPVGSITISSLRKTQIKTARIGIHSIYRELVIFAGGKSCLNMNLNTLLSIFKALILVLIRNPTELFLLFAQRELSVRGAIPIPMLGQAETDAPEVGTVGIEHAQTCNQFSGNSRGFGGSHEKGS